MDDLQKAKETVLLLTQQLDMLSYDLTKMGTEVTKEKLKTFGLTFMSLNVLMGILHGDDEADIFMDTVDATLDAMVDAGYKFKDGSNTEYSEHLRMAYTQHRMGFKPPVEEDVETKPKFDDDAFLDFLNEIGAFDK